MTQERNPHDPNGIMSCSDGNPATVCDISSTYQENPLAWIIHVADEAATYLLDR